MTELGWGEEDFLTLCTQRRGIFVTHLSGPLQQQSKWSTASLAWQSHFPHRPSPSQQLLLSLFTILLRFITELRTVYLHFNYFTIDILPEPIYNNKEKSRPIFTTISAASPYDTP